jgi:hypothetical protein
VGQRKKILETGLEGLVECSFCDYGVVIENKEKLSCHVGRASVRSRWVLFICALLSGKLVMSVSRTICIYQMLK